MEPRQINMGIEPTRHREFPDYLGKNVTKLLGECPSCHPER
jgi:hypothetical protein